MKISWESLPCYVVGSGPSLTKSVATAIRHARWRDEANVLAVNDAYKLLPTADVLYAADFAWWRKHEGAKDFSGQRWTSSSKSLNYCDDKSQVANEFDLHLVDGRDGNGFSDDGKSIRYGGAHAHSGFQAINLARMFGAKRIILVGFDYGGGHFFGAHEGLRNCTDADYANMTRAFEHVPADIGIVNATPGSKLTRFPFVDLNEEIERNRSLYRDGTVATG